MIRRSSMIALVAIILSLLVHMFGLGFTGSIRPKSASSEDTTEVVAVGNAFEDVAETVSEPVPPEPAPTPEPEPPEPAPEPAPPEPAPEPEPPEEAVPEPETAEVPTTEVLVASPDPQDTPVPDTGAAQVVLPDAAGSSELENGDVPQPATVEPTGGDDSETSDTEVTSPVEPEEVPETVQGGPDGVVEPVDAITAEPTPAPATAPVEEQLAALPAPVEPVAPVVPVAPIPEVSAVPVIPLISESIDPETAEAPVETESEQSDAATENSNGTSQTVLSSLRPQLPTNRPPVEPEGQPDGTATAKTPSSRPPLIESPLTAYRRDGTDLTIRQNNRSQSGGAGAQNFRGPGNSDVTNYAGRVFVHLNRAPAVRVSARGWTRVFFEINPDGSVGRIDIIDGTGSVEIERAARAQIRAAEPLPRPPNGNVRRMNLFYRPN